MNVIDMWKWKREHGEKRTRSRPSRGEGGYPGFVRIGAVSKELLERLR